MGATMSDKAVANFAKFDDQLDQLGLRFEAIKLAIAEGVVPWLVRMLNVLEYIRINAVSLVPTLQLLAHSIDFLNSIMSNPFDFKGRAAIGRQMAEDALAIARAAVNAKRELEGLKDLVSSLGNARAPHFGGGPAPFSLESLAGFSDAGSDAKLRAGGAQRLQVGPMLDDARFKLISLGEIIDRMAGNWVRAFQTFGQSVQSGIVSVFENLGNRAQTFRTAMVSIFESMALGVQRAIGQLLGSLAVKGLLSLLGTALSFLTGNPFISLGAQALGGGLGANLVAQSPSAQMSARSGPSGGGNTFVIQTISAKDVLQSLLSPRGVMRAANDRILEVAAAS
jgi:hypothetical protein